MPDVNPEHFFAEAAKAEGLSYHDYCKKYGILDESSDKRVKVHERQKKDTPDQWTTPSGSEPLGYVPSEDVEMTDKQIDDLIYYGDHKRKRRV